MAMDAQTLEASSKQFFFCFRTKLLSNANPFLPLFLPLGGRRPLVTTFWTAPMLPVEDGVAPLDQAPIFRLGKNELAQVVRFLSLRDLSLLYIASSPLLGASLLNSVVEARLTSPRSESRDEFRQPPSRLLTLLPALRVVKIRCSFIQSGPILSKLPSTVEHVEIWSVTRGSHLIDFKRRLPNLAFLQLNLKSYQDVGWMGTLPSSLTVLSVAQSFHDPHQVIQYLTGAVSLEELILGEDRPNDEDEDEDYVEEMAQEDAMGAMDVDATNDENEAQDSTASSTSQTHSTGPPLPQLIALELFSRALRNAPLLSELPPTLTHFAWDSGRAPFADGRLASLISTELGRSLSTRNPNSPSSSSSLSSSAPSSSSTAGDSSISFKQDRKHPSLLKSLHLAELPNTHYFDSAEGDTFYWVERLTIADEAFGYRNGISKYLTELRLLAEDTIDFATPNSPNVFRILHSAGTRLKLLQFGSVVLPQQATTLQDETREIITSVLATVTSLSVTEWHTLLLCTLPRGLEQLHLTYRAERDEFWGAKQLLQLPPTLLVFQAPWIRIELGDVPFLPRLLQHARFRPINDSGLGTRNLTPEMRAGSSLPYETITGSTNLLFGLPPNLTWLSVSMSTMTFESRFGMFLPRSVTRVDSSGGDIDTRDTSESRFRAIGAWLGVSEAPTAEGVLLTRALRFFPTGCTSNMYFGQQRMTVLQEVKYTTRETRRQE